MPLTADSNGTLNGSFTIPAGVPTGTKSVKFQGSGGTKGEALYTASGVIETRTLQQITTTVLSIGVDPLAQTFILSEDRLLGGIDLRFCVKGDVNNPVWVQIRETEAGVPGTTVLGEGVLNGNAISLVDWTRVTFGPPIPLVKDTYYAVVLLTDDPNHAVSIATLGDYVSPGNGPQEGWVTSQPYTIGELLSSSNARTWTTHPKSDLAMQILACKFTVNETTIPFGDLNPVGISDIIAQAGVYRPSGDTDVEFSFTPSGGGTVLKSAENEVIQLTEYVSGLYGMSAKLKGNSKMSPIIYADTQALFGICGNTGDYISRAIEADDDFDVSFTFEVFRPNAATVTPYMEVQRMLSGSPVIEGGVYQSDWATLTKDSQKRMADGWIEETWKVEGLRGVGLDWETRAKLILTGGAASRARVRNLRVIIK